MTAPPPPAAAADAAARLAFKLPDIGEGVHEGEIVAWRVAEGQDVREDDPLLEVMTDKVTAEIPSPATGRLVSRLAQEGQVVAVGSVIAILDLSAGVAAQPVEPVQAEAVAAPAVHSEQDKSLIAWEALPALPPTASRPGVLAAPATRRLARQLGVPLAQIRGTGAHGRVTPDDVRAASASPPAAPAPPLPAPPPAPPTPQPHGTAAPPPSHTAPPPPVPSVQAGRLIFEARQVPFTGIRRKTATHLHQAKQTAPHFGYVDEADVTRLIALHQELLPAAEARGVKLTYLPFVLRAVVLALHAVPVLQARLDEAQQVLVYPPEVNLGLAVATPQGLVVPVLRQAETKGLLALAEAIQQASDKARRGALALEDVRGGTFTVSNIGSVGGLFGLPIVNVPEVAILGVNKFQKRPVVRTVDGEDRVVIRQMTYLSISCDHRVVDGVDAAVFMNHLIQALEQPAALLL
jgi:pyruvate dehydrogenase E2 component (dihydrolipoamide acetyltransferase)